MKTMKKAFALLLAVVMVMGLSVTAFAEGETYSITINDAANGETYTAYKIFDATKSTSTSYVEDEDGTYYYDTDADSYVTDEPANPKKDNDDTVLKYAQVTTEHYSYSIATGSEWLPVVLNYMGYTYDETTSTWTDADNNEATSPFTGKGLTLTLSADGTEYVVEYTENTFSAPDFAAALNTAVHADGANYKTAATGTASNNTVTLNVSTDGAGYYFVDTSLGSLCSLDTVTGTEQVIYEKNSIPSITKKVKEDDNNTNHTALTQDYWKDSAVLDVIDTVSYQLTVNTGIDTEGDGTGVDADYTINDVMPKGIAFKDVAENAGITVTTATGVNGAAETWVYGTDYTYSWTANTTEGETTSGTLSIVLLSSGKLASLAEYTDITITYDATITAADVAIGTANTNNVTLTYKQQTSKADAVVYTYELVPTVTTQEGTEPAFVKVDGNTDSALEGVKFILSRTVGNETQYAVVTNGYLTQWTTEKSSATSLTTDANGTFNVQGLDAGTYILTETETLEGYNLLTDTITVVIAENGGVTYQYTSKIGTTGETAGSTITVVNETGTALPSTGGIGTTIFYVVGSILVIGAAILLITKKRMSNVQ